jgi:putative FmdB family regulatory protein
MPIYEYRCPDGHTFEVFQRMSDPEPAGCEQCGRGPVEKLLYPVAVHFKGSGFYTTDYGRGSGKKPSKDGGGESGSSSDSGSSSSSGDSGSSDSGSGGSTEKRAAAAD